MFVLRHPRGHCSVFSLQNLSAFCKFMHRGRNVAMPARLNRAAQPVTMMERARSAGQLLMGAKDYEEASEVFTQLVSQSDSRSDAYGRLGLATLAFAGIPADSHKVRAIFLLQFMRLLFKVREFTPTSWSESPQHVIGLGDLGLRCGPMPTIGAPPHATTINQLDSATLWRLLPPCRQGSDAADAFSIGAYPDAYTPTSAASSISHCVHGYITSNAGTTSAGM